MIDFGPLLDSVHTPNLDTLAIDTRSQIDLPEGQVGWHHLYEFLSHSRPPLTFLILHGMPTTTEEFIHCLVLVPRLQSLELDGRIFDDFVVSNLTWKPFESLRTTGYEEGNILPHLRALKMRDCPLSSSRERERLTLMLHSRLIYVVMAQTANDSDGWDGESMLRWGGPSSTLDEIQLSEHFEFWTGQVYSDADTKSLIDNPIIQSFIEKGLFSYNGAARNY
ncbi:hypothetical protein SCHPADRAFT_930663 [Schizopora paradoxa]|uniref:F-box domain-containing protein n=1 Tax=Schizopora paradoxa TaxID=27342 RepID=A0A0H2REJ0_9AGAM|nr:hypothetical protein SCHPADRAFT_930663 [Schizopora paradoxa]